MPKTVESARALLTRGRRGLTRLRRDRRGNFAILTAVAALPVMFTIGGAVDFNMYYANRTRIQNAADAAALAAAKRFPFDPDENRLESFARDYFEANTGQMFRTSATMDYDGTAMNANGVRELTISVEFTYDPLFLPMIAESFTGMGAEITHIQSVIAIGNTTVEMAMVLDTSGSMNDTPAGGGSSKIVTLRDVATDAIDQFFGGAQLSGVADPVRVSVVPFAGSVNLGVPLNTAWLDPKGLHPNHHDHLQWATLNYTTLPDTYREGSTDWTNTKYSANQIAVRDPRSTLPSNQRPWVRADNNDVYLTRQYLLANMGITSTTMPGTGCPRGHGYAAGVTCTWSTDGTNNWNNRVMRIAGLEQCRQGTGGLRAADPTCHPPYTLSRTSQYFNQSTGTNPRVCAETRSGPYALTDKTPTESDPASLFLPYFAPDEYDVYFNFANYYLRDGPGSPWTHPLGSTPLRDAAWDVRQKDVRKYLMNPSRITNAMGANNLYSPYFICESDALVPLSNDPAAARARVAALNATGATNVEEGIGWGWRTLSPGEPFTGGRANGDENNYKALVVMTDGANTYYPNTSMNKSGYGAYGFANDKRIFEHTSLNANSNSSYTSANLTKAMDERTAKLCENAKGDGRVPVRTARGDPVLNSAGQAVSRDGVLIYTIAFDIPAADKQRVDTLLRNCASAHIADQRSGLPAASSRKYFYSASSNQELEDAFRDIVASLSSLRIAR